jgi:predicted dehydrogenase
MNVAIIGCGLIGHKRAKNLGGHTLLVAADVMMDRAESLAKQYPGAIAMQSWEAAVAHESVDVVIVATTPDNLARVTLAALQAGKHVLVDKPAARHFEELDSVIELAKSKKLKVRTGFNHRFHPAMRKAKKIIDSGEIGQLMFIRGRYGHGGRLGYEKEWRADPTIGGGGELLDQGMHLIDLSRWYLGDFVHVDGYVKTYFWQMPVEDNGFMMLRTRKDQVAWLHVSWTEWKNTFSLEIYGQHGKLQIDGLGGSYGTEQLALYKMHPQMGPPETTIWQYPGEDQSWSLEFKEFVKDIEQDREPDPNASDAQEALRIVNAIYERTVAAVAGGTK